MERMIDQNVIILGGGITGLTAASELAHLGYHVEIIEKSESIGGHAVRLTCKATEKCVKCGACKVDEKIQIAHSHININIHMGCTLTGIKNGERISVYYRNQQDRKSSSNAEAVIIATGFHPFNPETKPYGYDRFKNVITSLELEKRIKEHNDIKKPSDLTPPEKIAFVQCVGSRDSSLNHLWCSKICCPSSLRMAHLIQTKQPGADISFFYIDFQNCGKDYQQFQTTIHKNFRTIRAIPGDILQTKNNHLEVSFFDPVDHKAKEEIFDLVVLSVGITPNQGNRDLSEKLGINLTEFGFFDTHNQTGMTSKAGIFAAGTACHPMGIEESLSSGIKTAFRVVEYLKNGK